MKAIVQERCFNHGLREAVARCPECRRFFCRECVTEHDDRVLCSACLAKSNTASLTRRRAFAGVRRAAQCIFGLLIAWFFFFLIGELLLQLPSNFHNDVLWTVPWTRQE